MGINLNRLTLFPHPTPLPGGEGDQSVMEDSGSHSMTHPDLPGGAAKGSQVQQLAIPASSPSIRSSGT